MKKIGFARSFAIMLPKVAKVSPAVFIIWQAATVIQGICIGMLAPITQMFFDSASNLAIGAGTVYSAVISLIALGSIHIGRNIINGFIHFNRTMYEQKAEGILALEIHDKINNIPPAHFEDTKLLDETNKALQGKKEAVAFTCSILNSLNFHFVYFAIMAFYLFRLRPLLVVSLVFVFVPILLTQIIRAKIFTKVEDKSAPVRRELDYYEQCMTVREYFKETRLLGAFGYFKNLYSDSLLLLTKLRIRAVATSDFAQLGVQMLSLGGQAGILLLLLDSLLNGSITVGAFAAVFSSVDMMFRLMNQLVSQNFGTVAREFGKVQRYLEFLQIPNRGGSNTALNTDCDISLHNVSFTYPNSTEKAMEIKNLTIKKGETLAVVGENGAGKSTFIRLVTGLYLPDDGEVKYGNISTKEISPHLLFKNTSAVFQKFQRYQMTLLDNISISDTKAKICDSKLDEASIKAGVNKKAQQFPNGYETMLSREFDGVDLSGGQWQRIAIARGLFRNHNFIVLDEPTSAIDPVEETKLYKIFEEITKEKTAIIVTHRLGSVKFADRILVMKQGKIAELGTHEYLISLNGEYARLYGMQEQWYRS